MLEKLSFGIRKRAVEYKDFIPLKALIEAYIFANELMVVLGYEILHIVTFYTKFKRVYF